MIINSGVRDNIVGVTFAGARAEVSQRTENWDTGEDLRLAGALECVLDALDAPHAALAGRALSTLKFTLI